MNCNCRYIKNIVYTSSFLLAPHRLICCPCGRISNALIPHLDSTAREPKRSAGSLCEPGRWVRSKRCTSAVAAKSMSSPHGRTETRGVTSRRSVSEENQLREGSRRVRRSFFVFADQGSRGFAQNSFQHRQSITSKKE